MASLSRVIARVTALIVLLLSCPLLVLPQSTQGSGPALAQLLDSGGALMRAGDYPSAIPHFRRALKVDPRSPQAHYYLGSCYLRTGQLTYAVSSFTSALRLAPQSLPARRGLGLAHYRLGQYAECVEALRPSAPALAGDLEAQAAYGRSLLALNRAQEALPHLLAAHAANRRDASLLIAIAEAYRALNSAAEAERYYEAVLLLDPRQSAASHGLLSLYRDTGRHLDARQLLRKMLAATPNDPLLLAELARADQALGLHHEALAIYEKLSQLVRGPQALELHLTLAEAYMAADQPALARPHYQAAVAQRPKDARLRADLGLSLRALGQRGQAVEEYRQAIRLEPQVAAWHFREAELLGELGRGEDALAAYRAGLALEPGNQAALVALAALARELGRTDLARDALIALVAAQPQVLSVRLALSDAYRDLGDARAATAQAWEVLRIEPQNVEARFRLARSAEDLGDLDGAIRHLEVIQTTAPTEVRYLVPLGRLLAAQGRQEEAVAEYQRLLDFEPQDLVVRSDLAALYLKMGRPAEARPLLSDLLAERPDSVWAVDRLAQCEELAGRAEDAIRLRRQVASASPDDPEYLESLVRTCERAARPREATDFLTTLLAVPDPPRTAVATLVAAYRRHDGQEAALEQIRGLAGIFRARPVFRRVAAEACAAAGLRQEAIEWLGWYLDARPDDSEALTGLVALCREEGSLETAQERLLRHVARAPEDRLALLQLARVSFEAEHFAAALAAAEKALQLDASDPAAFRLLADTLARQYGAAQAVRTLRTRAAATVDPASSVGLAYAYVLSGDPDRALETLASAVETRRSAAEAAYVRGLARNALGLHEDAVTEFGRASSGASDDPDYRAMLAGALTMAGRPEDALWEYARLLTDQAGEGQGRHGVRQLLAARAVPPGLVCEALRRVAVDRGPSRSLIALLADPLATEAPGQTVAALRDITGVWESSEESWSALAGAYQNTGQADEEARVLTRLVDLRPSDLSYCLRLARAYERANAPTSAVTAYSMALAADPGNSEARQALTRLSTHESRLPGPHPAPPPSSTTVAGTSPR